MINRMRIGAGAVLLAAVGIAACGGSPESKKAAAGGSAGMAGSAQAGGAAGSAGMPSLVLGGTGGGDAGPATIPLKPPGKIDLEACKKISEDGSAQSAGDCFVCCNQAGLVNSGFFQGSCACGAEIEGRSVCAAQTGGADACQACCDSASYSSSGFSPGPPASCECDAHTDGKVCAPQTSRANCAVCCINAGYVSSVYSGTCSCFDG
jgi:hypothetical protein